MPKLQHKMKASTYMRFLHKTPLITATTPIPGWRQPLGAAFISARHTATTSRSVPAPNPATTPVWAQTYEAPKTGILSYLPSAFVPYAELSRFDKPVGTYYLFFPCLFSTLLAANLTTPLAPPSDILTMTALFLFGALVMRGAGCTINDLWDRNLDPHVARTALRPLARRAVTPFAALTYAGAQCLTGLAILLQFPLACVPYAVPSLVFVALYPLAKRVTYYPQAMLGLTFSWGAIMGFPALGIDLLSHPSALTAAGCLYASNVAWTIAYDAVYAHMDLKDDKKAGIKSIARAHPTTTKSVLAGLTAVQTALLAGAGAAIGAGPVWYAGVCGAAVLGNGLQIWKVKLDDARDCWWWFRNGVWITGGGIAAGMGAEYTTHYLGWYEDEKVTGQQDAKAGV